MQTKEEITVVRAHVSDEERIGQLVSEAQEHDNAIKFGIAHCGEKMVQRGNALNKAMQLAGGKGKLGEILEKFWKGKPISTRTAYRYMRLATEEARVTMVSQFEAHTHKQLDGKVEDEDSSEDDAEPLTPEERKRLISLVATTKPGLAKKLRDGTKKMTDAELEEEVPLCCDKCRRMGPPPKPCPFCAELRAVAGQEPANPDDPASPPEPPPDPYKQAKSFVAKTAAALTKLVGEDAVLLEAFTVCRLMDLGTGKVRCRAFAGVAKVIEMVADGETDMKIIAAAYDIASGGFVPPMYEHKRGL